MGGAGRGGGSVGWDHRLHPELNLQLEVYLSLIHRAVRIGEEFAIGRRRGGTPWRNSEG